MTPSNCGVHGAAVYSPTGETMNAGTTSTGMFTSRASRTAGPCHVAGDGDVFAVCPLAHAIVSFVVPLSSFVCEHP